MRSGGEVFGKILDTCLWAIARCSSGVHRHEVTMCNTTAHIERILDLVQFAACASQNWRGTKLRLEGAGDGRVGVRLAGARGDAGIRKPLETSADGWKGWLAQVVPGM